MKRNITIRCVMPQLNPNTELGRVGMAGYATRRRRSRRIREEAIRRQTVSPQIAGAKMVRLLDGDGLLTKQEFVLAGTGLKPLEE